MPVKVTKLTPANVAALRTSFGGNDQVSVTTTTAEFDMSTSEALQLVVDAQNAAGPGTVRHSLHAVRRKLHRIVLEQRNNVP